MLRTLGVPDRCRLPPGKTAVRAGLRAAPKRSRHMRGRRVRVCEECRFGRGEKVCLDRDFASGRTAGKTKNEENMFSSFFVFPAVRPDAKSLSKQTFSPRPNRHSSQTRTRRPLICLDRFGAARRPARTAVFPGGSLQRSGTPSVRSKACP